MGEHPGCAIRYGYHPASRLDFIAAQDYEFRYGYLPHPAWRAVRHSPSCEDGEPPGATISIVGKWNATATASEGEELSSVVTFVQNDQSLVGKPVSERGRVDFEAVKVDGKWTASRRS